LNELFDFREFFGVYDVDRESGWMENLVGWKTRK